MKSKIFLIIGVVLSIALIVACYIKFYLNKDYDFLIEASCDPTTEKCFYRNCEVEECPPNGLSDYKTFKVKASDFGKCADDGCQNECKAGEIRCEEIICDEAVGDICSPSNQ